MIVLIVLLLATTGNGQTTVPRVLMSPNGPETSAISWGHLTLQKLGNPETVLNSLDLCLEMGITLLDTADVYPPLEEQGLNIRLLGQALSLRDASFRAGFEIVAKIGIQSFVPFVINTTRAYVQQQVALYLDALQTDYLDVLLIHQPDPNVDVNELSQTAEEYVAAGVIRYFGVSNWVPSEFDRLQAAYHYELVSNEVEFSVITPDEHDQGRVLDHMKSLNRKPMLWGPLGGDPVGRDNRLFTPPYNLRTRRILDALQEVADEIGNGATQDEVALAWTMFDSNSIPIVGTMQMNRLEQQVFGALQRVLPNMTQSQFDRIMDAAS